MCVLVCVCVLCPASLGGVCAGCEIKVCVCGGWLGCWRISSQSDAVCDWLMRVLAKAELYNELSETDGTLKKSRMGAATSSHTGTAEEKWPFRNQHDAF